MNRRLITTGVTLFSALALACAAAVAEEKTDRYVGYYYPRPAAIEVYHARAQTLPEANRSRRIGFVVGVVNQMRQRPYPPEYAFFAKGGEAHKLIIVSNRAGRLNTIYRVRALLATLTSVARTTPIFREYNVEDYFTFLDLVKMLGFELVTVSDGDTFTHQIVLE